MYNILIPGYTIRAGPRGRPGIRSQGWQTGKSKKHAYTFQAKRALTPVINVKQYNPSIDNPAGSEERMKSWLVEVLQPLNLQEDFLDRMLRSAHAVGVGRLAEAGSARLLVYSPPGLPEGQTWGFFRIEKAGDKSRSRHSIEFYLYLEDP